jgi:hypothetical protein
MTPRCSTPPCRVCTRGVEPSGKEFGAHIGPPMRVLARCSSACQQTAAWYGGVGSFQKRSNGQVDRRSRRSLAELAPVEPDHGRCADQHQPRMRAGSQRCAGFAQSRGGPRATAGPADACVARRGTCPGADGRPHRRRPRRPRAWWAWRCIAPQGWQRPATGPGLVVGDGGGAGARRASAERCGGTVWRAPLPS